MEKLERQLKIIIYLLFTAMILIGLIFGEKYWIFSFVAIDLGLIYLLMQLTYHYPQDTRTWSTLRNLTFKKIWNAIKL